MSAAPDYRSESPEDPLEPALIRLCQLDRFTVDEIHQAQREHNLSFADAALRLGHATPLDIDDAHGSTRKVAVLERRPLRPGPELIIAHDPFHDHSERVRSLRTELLLRHQAGRANAFAVISGSPGEGRSRLAAELAISFSQLGQPTLLVDADLRRPRQHLLYDADNRIGLAQAIASGDAPYLHPVEHLPHLSVLMAGQLAPNPVELLSDGRFELMLDLWRQRYEHVVIDTSAAREFSDALAVSTVVGRALLVTRAKLTPHKATRDLLRRLTATQCRVIGGVINHF